MHKGFVAGGFVPFMRENFDEDIRFILVEGSENAADRFMDEKSFEKDDVLTISHIRQVYSKKECLKWLRESDAIILNWVDAYTILALMPFFSKIALLFWGADLQNAKRLIARGGIKGAVERALMEKARCIITLLPGDYAELCSVCQPRGRWFLGMIWSKTLDETHIQPALAAQMSGKNFLVGNSATPTNRHKEVFTYLSRFVDEGIEVYVPLSYGDDEYRQGVLEEGERLLGQSFHPLLDFMDHSEYAAFLGTISVAVFNNNRQQGMGNINTLLAQGAKVYLADDGPMYHDFSQDGYHVGKVADIACSGYEEVVAFSEECRRDNAAKGAFARQHDRAIELWQDIIDYLQGSMRA